MLLPDVQTFHYDGLLLICYVPNGTIMITHPLDITVIFDEMMRTLGYTPYMMPMMKLSCGAELWLDL